MNDYSADVAYLMSRDPSVTGRLDVLDRMVISLMKESHPVEQTTQTHIPEGPPLDHLAQALARVSSLEKRVTALEAAMLDVIGKLPPPVQPDDPVLGTREVSNLLGMDVGGVIALVKAGMIPGNQAHGRAGYTIKRSDVAAFAERIGKPLKP